VYSLVAGPFAEFKTCEDRYLPVPLRLFCRKSLAKYLEK
jgi:aminopeptidase N